MANTYTTRPGTITPRAAAASARLGAEALLDETPEAPWAIYTDDRSVPGTVLIGFARRGVAACVLLVPAADYDGLALLQRIQAGMP